jgi:hypothetical protein
MDLGERDARFRFLVRDREGQFSASFDAVLTDAGLRWSRSRPAARGELLRRTPRVDRRTELTDRMLIFGVRHLRTVLAAPCGALQHPATASSAAATSAAPESPVAEPGVDRSSAA